MPAFWKAGPTDLTSRASSGSRKSMPGYPHGKRFCGSFWSVTASTGTPARS